MLPRSAPIWSALTATTLAVLLLLLTMSGCASTERLPERAAMAPVGPLAAAVVERESAMDLPALNVERATAVAGVVLPTIAQPALRSSSRSVTKPAPSTLRAPVKPTASPPPPIRLQPHELRTVVLAKSEATPTMDFKSLEARLKETNAIDAFTKLKLKTEVDVLLGQFRAYYQGHLRASLTDLRRSYDQLMFKVLALLQN